MSLNFNDQKIPSKVSVRRNDPSCKKPRIISGIICKVLARRRRTEPSMLTTLS